MIKTDVTERKNRQWRVPWRHWLLAAVVMTSGNSKANSLSEEQAALLADVSAEQAQFAEIAMRIWEYAEVGYQEHQSSRLLQETLKTAGFEVEAGLAGMPTAFVASYGQGEPVIGI